MSDIDYEKLLCEILKPLEGELYTVEISSFYGIVSPKSFALSKATVWSEYGNTATVWIYNNGEVVCHNGYNNNDDFYINLVVPGSIEKLLDNIRQKRISLEKHYG